MKITIGPFFCASSETSGGGEVQPLNVRVEWAGADRAVSLPLFQARPEGISKTRFHHIVVHANRIPCEVTYPKYQAIETPGGVFVPLEAVLVAVCRDNEVNRDICEVLQELGEFVSLHNFIRDHVPKEGLLLPAVEQAGFRIVNVLREGDVVWTELGWNPVKSTNLFHTANCRFRVKAGSTAEDCWIQVEQAVGVSGLLAKKLHDAFPGSPRALLTTAGLDHVVSLVRQD